MATQQTPTSYKDPFWSDLASGTEQKLGLPSGLLVSVLTRGERSNADQVSEAGAKTPFQIIPATRQAVLKKYGVDAYLSPQNSAKAAGLLLKESLDRNKGDIKLAAAEYHGGTNPANWGPRTKAYIERVSSGVRELVPQAAPAQSSTIAEGGTTSTFQRALGASSMGAVPPDAIAKVFQAYSSGQMNPQESAEFEADVRGGSVMLPRGAALRGEQPQGARPTMPELPAAVLEAYSTGRMTRDEMMELERDVSSGMAKVPTGFAIKKTEPMGIVGGIREAVTGTERGTPTTQALPDYAGMPELNTFSMSSFKSALGTMMTNPQETVQVIQSNFPGVQVSQDEKGNFVLQSSIDGQFYAIKPGFQVSDIPRAAGALAAFTPAGRAATIPGAIVAGGATQAAIEASQAATGGEFNKADVAMAAATGPAGQILQRVAPPVVQAVKKGVQRVTGRAPVPAAAPGAPGASVGTAITPEAPPAAAAMPEAVPAAPVQTAPAAASTAPTVAPVVAEVTEEEVGSLVKKAAGTGFGSAGARDRLADLAQVNTAAKEAADRLGIQLPADVFSDNPQVRAAAGLTRSAAGSEAEAGWRNTVTQAVDKADDVIKQFDATFVEGAVAPGVVSQKIKDSLTKTRSDLNAQAGKLYDVVDEVVPKTSLVELPKLKETLDAVKAEVTEKGMSAAERNLAKMIEEGNITYGRLKREKTLIGNAINKMESPYGSMAEADLKRLYAALADDQLTNVGNIGGEELRQQLRAANLIYAKERALGKRIVNAFGQDIEGSVANKMRTAITGAAKGDAGEFNRLLKTVPDDLRKETLATALASVTRSTRGAEKGGFGFSEFADIYPKLRANPPVYKTIVDTLGKDSADVLRDLYEVSKRVTEARANVLTTGKANQALLQGMQAESLIGKVMESTLAKGALTGAAAMGGPIAAAATSVITGAMTQGNKDALKAAGKLFADEGFQKLAIEAATKGTPSAASIRRTAMSQSFQKFANAAKLPKALDARIQWLQNAAQTERQFDQENQ